MEPTMQQQPQPTNGVALAKQASAATIEVAPRTGEIVRVGFDTIQGYEALQRIAKAFNASNLVPEQYRGPAGFPNCVIAIEMAMRMRASPLQVMQNLYVVHGRPAWSSQFLIASFNACGRFAAIRYRFIGDRNGDSWGCVAWTKELASGDPIEGPEVTIAMSKKEGWFGKNGSKWQTIPQLMLTYRAATFLVRTTAPELTMGLRTADEVEDIGEQEERFVAPPEPAALPVAAASAPAPEAAPAVAPQSMPDALAEAQATLRAAAGEVKAS